MGAWNPRLICSAGVSACSSLRWIDSQPACVSDTEPANLRGRPPKITTACSQTTLQAFRR